MNIGLTSFGKGGIVAQVDGYCSARSIERARWSDKCISIRRGKLL